MKSLCTFLLLLLTSYTIAQFPQPATPDKIYGDLFTEVQMKKVFPDEKTFLDCIPKRKPVDIMYDFGIQKGPGFNIKKFVEENFELPPGEAGNYTRDSADDVITHIKKMWPVLKRGPDKEVEGSSLLPLPYPYILQSGRFREMYYWDSYFIMLGLKESGDIKTIRDMLGNFAYLIGKYGHVPSGNRSY